jgi:FlaA1/EpsC-like NDP-sugar epimerase
MRTRVHWFIKGISQVALDILVFAAAIVAAYFMRFEGPPPADFLRQMLILLPYLIVIRLLFFNIVSVYSVAWRYVSIRELILIVTALLPVSLALLGLRLFLHEGLSLFRVPLSVIALEFLLALVGTTGIRVARRLFHEWTNRGAFNQNGRPTKKNTILIGAGDAGNLVVKELKRRPDLGLNVVGFVDDDVQKHLSTIQGVRVLGDTSRLPEIVRRHRVEEAVITIANASSKDIRRIKEACEKARIKVRIVPGLFELFDDEVKIMKIRDINIEDVLGRSVVRFDNHRREVMSRYHGKRIMVTGAGGSIGSELCRQLASLKPAELVMLDKDEYSIYAVERRMRQEFPEVRTVPVIGDVRSRPRLGRVFERFRPQIIFHAAAHKHVPLMELNVAEAISNNVLGTKTTAELAAERGVENFIFISTDKAVNPMSVMGASKKIGEIMIRELAAAANGTRFSCVRFGNVVGSRGSVVPLFREQIAQGGPLTVTHPDVRRYFMSISEAVQLIIQAGSIGDRGEILVLDMGEPIRIQDLARDLIKLSGYADGDIEIKYIGLRPGEKLLEEILVDEEKARGTEFDKIFIAPPNDVDARRFFENLAALLEAAEAGDEEKILRSLRDMGIGYNQNPGKIV